MLEKEIKLQYEEIKKIQKRTTEFLEKQEKALDKVIKNLDALYEKAQETIKNEALDVENMTYEKLKDVVRDDKTSSQALDEIYKELRENPKVKIDEKSKAALYAMIYQNSNVSEKILIDLSLNGGFNIKMDMAQNPKTPQEALKNLYNDDNSIIVKYILSNPSMPRELITEMAEGKVKMMSRWFLKSKLVTDKELLKYVHRLCLETSKKSDHELMKVIAMRKLSNEMIDLIKNSNHEGSKKALEDKKCLDVTSVPGGSSIKEMLEENVTSCAINTVADTLKFPEKVIYIYCLGLADGKVKKIDKYIKCVKKMGLSFNVK